MVKMGRKKNPTQYLSFFRFRQMANVDGKGLLCQSFFFLETYIMLVCQSFLADIAKIVKFHSVFFAYQLNCDKV